MSGARIVFVKLGGSLITDKTQSMTPRPGVIQRLADEIRQAMTTVPGLQLLIGHGSGSFGHTVANQFQTQSGGIGQDYWRGFSEVWAAARELNQIVINALIGAGLPVIAFPPSAGVIAQGTHIQSWDISPIQAALSHNLVPVVFGDVIFDTVLGGTILSTEAIFQHLAGAIHPDEILLAGQDKGVYQDPHHPEKIIAQITPQTITTVLPALSPSQAVDVTGGMLSKVKLMVSLIREHPSLRVRIFSGLEPGNLYQALTAENISFGTLIAHQEHLPSPGP
ncbi:MAG: isopentenyl phosphate kinase family protein [Brevefilum sp.]|nr:isopentenyl phosphate kinase family protein [Brevefilum sp.]